MSTISGGCLCGAVRFEVLDAFQTFHLCHCVQCRKVTGSAHASNLFAPGENFKLLAGEEFISHYSHPERDFSKSFCKICGSGLPFIGKDSGRIIVPAGSLDKEPTLKPQDNIFWRERTAWASAGDDAPHYDGFPD